MKGIINFVYRHVTWLLMLILALIVTWYLVGNIDAILKTFLIIIAVESLALALSGIALFVYTNVNFTKGLLDYDKNDKYNSIEISAFSRVIAFIFLGVHILVGLVIFSIYLSQFVN